MAAATPVDSMMGFIRTIAGLMRRLLSAAIDLQPIYQEIRGIGWQ